MFHVKHRSLLHGIIGRGRAAATSRDRRPVRVTELSTQVDSSTEERASLVHNPESMAGSGHSELEVEESESLRSDANTAGPMTDPVPGPRTESATDGVSRETPPPMDDTSFGRAAPLAVEALGRAGEGERAGARHRLLGHVVHGYGQPAGREARLDHGDRAQSRVSP